MPRAESRPARAERKSNSGSPPAQHRSIRLARTDRRADFAAAPETRPPPRKAPRQPECHVRCAASEGQKLPARIQTGFHRDGQAPHETASSRFRSPKLGTCPSAARSPRPQTEVRIALRKFRRSGGAYAGARVILLPHVNVNIVG